MRQNIEIKKTASPNAPKRLKETMYTVGGDKMGNFKDFKKQQLGKSVRTSMIFVPAGEFVKRWKTTTKRWKDMGEYTVPDDLVKQYKTEYRTDAFYIDKYEVSVGEYKAYLAINKIEDDNPLIEWDQSDYGDAAPTGWHKGDKYPMRAITWEQASSFCAFFGGRLPTALEWERAALGGAKTRYAFGDDTSQFVDYAWYGKDVQPVGRKKPNKYGIYDMYGNVSEWTSSSLLDNYLFYWRSINNKDAEIRIKGNDIFIYGDKEGWSKLTRDANKSRLVCGDSYGSGIPVCNKQQPICLTPCGEYAGQDKWTMSRGFRCAMDAKKP